MREDGLAEADVVISVCEFSAVDPFYEMAVASFFEFVTGDQHLVFELRVVGIESEIDLLFLDEQFASLFEQCTLEFKGKLLDY